MGYDRKKSSRKRICLRNKKFGDCRVALHEDRNEVEKEEYEGNETGLSILSLSPTTVSIPFIKSFSLYSCQASNSSQLGKETINVLSFSAPLFISRMMKKLFSCSVLYFLCSLTHSRVCNENPTSKTVTFRKRTNSLGLRELTKKKSVLKHDGN